VLVRSIRYPREHIADYSRQCTAPTLTSVLMLSWANAMLWITYVSALSSSHAWSFDEGALLRDLVVTLDSEQARCLNATDNLSGLGNLCTALNLIAEHWDDGCSSVFDRMKSLSESYLMCLAAAECRIDKASLDPIHGECLAACENKQQANGTVSENGTMTGNTTVTITECEVPLLKKAGIEHEEVCGDSMPLDFYFNFLSVNDFLLLLGTGVLGLILSVFDGLIAEEKEKMTWSFFEVFDLFTSSICILWVVINFCSQLADFSLSSHCKFALLASASMYGPYLYSMNAILAVVLSKHISSNGDPNKCNTVLYVILMVLCGLIGGVSAGLVLCVWAALFISSFWALVAYIHVFLLCCFPLAISFKMLDIAARGDYLYKSTAVFGAYLQLMIALLLASWGMITYILVAGFLLYFHGNYSGFHEGFFSSFSVPPMAWPDLQLLIDIPNLASVWARMISFDTTLSASAIVTMIIWVHTVCLILAKVGKATCKLWKLARG